MKKVYLDSDAIVASYDMKDALHGRAVRYMGKIGYGEFLTLVGMNVLIESLTIVSQRLGIRKSIELLGYFYDFCEIVYLDKKIIDEANEFFKKRTSKNVSYGDCISFAIMKVKNIKKVFSFDGHFKKQGFEVLG